MESDPELASAPDRTPGQTPAEDTSEGPPGSPSRAPLERAKPPSPGIPLPKRLVLFDGVCGLCNRSIDFLVRVDRKRLLRYAPLQGKTVGQTVGETVGKAVGETAGTMASLATAADALETLVFIDDGEVFYRSRAVFRCARYLPWPFRLISWLRWLPLSLTDGVYRRVSAARYRLFGKREVCRLPSPEERSLFLP